MNRYEAYRDSGIDWIGEIPEHWEVFRLGMIGHFSKGKTITNSDLSKFGNPVILYSHLYTTYDRVASKIKYFITDELYKQSTRISSGTFLFTSSGESVEEIGKCVLYNGDTEISIGGDMAVFKLSATGFFELEFLSFIFTLFSSFFLPIFFVLFKTLFYFLIR